MKTQEERLRAPGLAVPPPPRPSRRRPVVENTPPPPPPAGRARPVRPVIRDQRPLPDFDPEEIQPGQDENIIFRIHPAFFEVGIAYLGGILGSLLVAAVSAYVGLPFIFVVLCAVIFLIPGVVRHVRRNLTIYTLTRIKVVIQTGLFSKKVRNIPLRNIQDVYVIETFKERVAGIGDVIIDSAATSGRIAMENINNPRDYADMILDQLQRWQ